MITNKDIRVENGSLIINGDPYPLDGQSPEAIMQIVKDNSNTTPTENSTAPVTSGGVFAADKAISDTIGDLTGTGIAGASVASQLGNIHGQIGSLKFAVISQTFTGVDINVAWGTLYQSPADLSIDISSLNLQSMPKWFSVGIQTAWAAFFITLPIATNTAINFRPIRPTTSTGVSITATALVIY